MCLFRFFTCSDILMLAELHWNTWENQTLLPQINRCRLMNVIHTKHCRNNLKRIIMREAMMGLSIRKLAAKSWIVRSGSVTSDWLPKASEEARKFFCNAFDTPTQIYHFIYTLTELIRCLNSQTLIQMHPQPGRLSSPFMSHTCDIFMSQIVPGAFKLYTSPSFGSGTLTDC